MAVRAEARERVMAQPVVGYMPDDTPHPAALLSLGIQQVLTMFPATVLVAILTKFDIGVTLLTAGIGTIIALLVTNRRIPLFYGPSFSYITVMVTLMSVYDPVCFKNASSTFCPTGVQIAQVGIIGSGIVELLFGLLIMKVGKATVDKLLPPIVTGSIAMTIGMSLTGAALGMAQANWGIAFLTLFATVVFSVYFQGRGLLGMLPVLMGAVVGYAAAVIRGIVNFGEVQATPWLSAPHVTMPAFTDPRAWGAVVSISLIAIAVIPESTAHLYQLSLYIDQLAKDLGRKPTSIKDLLGLNLVADFFDDVVNGLLGGCAGTNYGENNSLMAVTRCYSAPVIFVAGIIAAMMGFIGKLAAVVHSIPSAVTGGLMIYLFGVIAKQGVALIQSEKVNLFEPRNLAIGATILVLGVGGSMGLKDGLFPLVVPIIFPNGIPAIVFSAIVGILMNVLFIVVPPARFGVADRAAIE